MKRGEHEELRLLRLLSIHASLAAQFETVVMLLPADVKANEVIAYGIFARQVEFFCRDGTAIDLHVICARVAGS